eukprot:TRINITY_DN243_c0_g1_i5.p2 TRINITY_DN243_c0_g1~~TRINITY_DN243_c0_g1_i5.p2  ORF type:complete len:123 (-),score=24.79 TRINITY_DN243_c0_g1_i5:91-459(-)
MTAGPKYTYHWVEQQQEVKLTAGEYIEKILEWADNTLLDKNIFPTQTGVPFPDNFMSIISSIFRRIFRIYAHIYVHHVASMSQNNREFLEVSFKHFYFFSKEFSLIPENELRPLERVIKEFV